ncbi:MAG: NAD(P)-binding domain-containing protein [Pirellulales bacterium]
MSDTITLPRASTRTKRIPRPSEKPPRRETSPAASTSFRAAPPRRPYRPQARVLVIGAGPAGLATAASLKMVGVRADLVDRSGRIGGAYARLEGGIVLSSPAKTTQLPGLPIEAPTRYITIADYRRYLRRYAAHHGLVADRQHIDKIERVGDRYRVFMAGESQPRRYEAVVVATGMCDHPVQPTIAGLSDGQGDKLGPRVFHSRDWPGHAAVAGQRILIVGGASSAIAIAEQCAKAGTAVVVSSRRERVRFSWAKVLGYDLRRLTYPLTRRLPRWLFGERCGSRPAFTGTDNGFRKYRKQGLVEVQGPVVKFNGRQATFADGWAARFDVVVLATGFEFKMPFLPNQVARASGGQPLADDNQSRSWPGLYFVGIPCGRTVASEFLHGMAADAPKVAAQIRARLRVR